MTASSFVTNTKFDIELLNFEEFKKRPFSLPHIGKDLIKGNAILFILESHYVDSEFFQYQKAYDNLKIEHPSKFYDIEENGLTKAFKEYLNTRQIIKNSLSADKTLAKGKSVYRKLSSVIQEGLDLKYNETSLPLDFVGVYNYFQRPSYKLSSSIKVCDKDIVVAYNTLNHILKVIDFHKIIFISAKAYNCFFDQDNLNNKKIQKSRKAFRGSHPRTWGYPCSYETGISWRQWVINRIKN